MKAFIDCFKGDYAIIHMEDGKTRLEIPRRLLPAGSREGSWLDVSFTLDPGEARKQEETILKALGKLNFKNK